MEKRWRENDNGDDDDKAEEANEDVIANEDEGEVSGRGEYSTKNQGNNAQYNANKKAERKKTKNKNTQVPFVDISMSTVPFMFPFGDIGVILPFRGDIGVMLPFIFPFGGIIGWGWIGVIVFWLLAVLPRLSC